MVSFINMGRLGNFLFQAATTIAYALKHNQEFTVPYKTKNPLWDPVYFPHLIKAMPQMKYGPAYIKEQGHQYQELPWEEWWGKRNIFLQGYFQSEKYFKDYRAEVLKAFNLPWVPHNNVSIHVRRGDYLQYPNKHPVVPDSFYYEAIKTFHYKGHRFFKVFSDDIDWCVKYFEVIKLSFAYIIFDYQKGGTPMEDLIGISECAGGHINSSSTFAWWGAWLNQNPQKIVITPKLWFVPGHGGLDTSDIIPDEWIKL